MDKINIGNGFRGLLYDVIMTSLKWNDIIGKRHVMICKHRLFALADIFAREWLFEAIFASNKDVFAKKACYDVIMTSLKNCSSNVLETSIFEFSRQLYVRLGVKDTINTQ